ncbi:hypothetical protein FSP39_018163 [Pinctada imbricata]|uniref:Uncharacterized protein n=1 Tax=Pinctada imbricata TaxID=66713 RepID=A0AA88YDF3_PINIB|nr:hypothetical protein FSP39_018163 [Pinctada imbricata]
MSDADVENGDHIGLLAQKPNPSLKFDKKLSETERSTRPDVAEFNIEPMESLMTSSEKLTWDIAHLKFVLSINFDCVH